MMMKEVEALAGSMCKRAISGSQQLCGTVMEAQDQQFPNLD